MSQENYVRVEKPGEKDYRPCQSCKDYGHDLVIISTGVKYRGMYEQATWRLCPACFVRGVVEDVAPVVVTREPLE